MAELKSNIISIQSRDMSRDCKHFRIKVDKNLWYIECADCGEKLDPIYWLSLRAREEDFVRWEKSELERHVKRLQNKTRVKCRNCGTFTDIKP